MRTKANTICIFILLFQYIFDASIYSSVVDVVTVEGNVRFCIHVCMQNSNVTAVGFQRYAFNSPKFQEMPSEASILTFIVPILKSRLFFFATVSLSHHVKYCRCRH
jgi:hypothetical protein